MFQRMGHPSFLGLLSNAKSSSTSLTFVLISIQESEIFRKFGGVVTESNVLSGSSAQSEIRSDEIYDGHEVDLFTGCLCEHSRMTTSF